MLLNGSEIYKIIKNNKELLKAMLIYFWGRSMRRSNLIKYEAFGEHMSVGVDDTNGHKRISSFKINARRKIA